MDSDKCPLCGGIGFVSRIDEEGVERFSRCKCQLKEIMNNRLRFANIPESLKNVTLKDFSLVVYQDQSAKEMMKISCKAIKAYIDNFNEMQKKGMGLYIYSKTKGSGKTFMMAAIANELLKEHQVKFASSTKILSEIRSTFNDKRGYTENKLISDITKTEVLIIDDFGTENITRWVNDVFYQIINDRYLKKKVTLFTSNESIRTINYDDRITNRIMERCYEITFAEESVREHIADANKIEMRRMLA